MYSVFEVSKSKKLCELGVVIFRNMCFYVLGLSASDMFDLFIIDVEAKRKIESMHMQKEDFFNTIFFLNCIQQSPILG